MAPPSAPPTPTSPFPPSSTPQPSSLSRLTLSDKLLLAQAVHHIGTSPPDWGRVSSVLLSHPLIRTKGRLEQASKAGITLGRIFGSRECERAWVALMRQYNLVLQPGEKDTISEVEGDGSSTLANRAKEARGLPPKTDRASQLALAQFLYAERIREIQESIKVKEQMFKALAADIEALNSGAMDAKLAAEVTLINSQAVTPVAEVNTRPPPKDRSSTGPSATTPGGTTRANRRPSRSDSSAANPASTAHDGQADTIEAGDVDISISHDNSRDIDMTIREESQLLGSEIDDIDNTREEQIAEAEEERKEDDSIIEQTQELDDTEAAAEEEKPAEPAPKSTRSSARKRGSDAGLKKQPAQEAHAKDGDAAESREEEQEAIDTGDKDGDVDMEDDIQHKQAQPRRSRRAGRTTGAEEDVQMAVAPASAVASSTKNRLGALRSRETSGASPDGEEEGESADVDTSRSTIERGSRASNSPVPARKGRGTSRLSGNKATTRRSRGGSNTSRNEGEQMTDAERDRIEREKAKRKNEKVLMMLLNEVSNHTHGNLFHSAIKEQDAPDYYTLIRHPMDIKTIKTRIKEGVIVNSVQLRRALNQMFANSLIYNRPGTEIHRMALEMRDSAEQMIDRFEHSASYARR